MTDDLKLVERLRNPDYAGELQHLRSAYEIDNLMRQSADAIGRLVRERDRLAALDAENAELRAAKDALWREYREAKSDWHEECADNRKLFEDWRAAEADRDRLAKLVAEMREVLSETLTAAVRNETGAFEGRARAILQRTQEQVG